MVKVLRDPCYDVLYLNSFFAHEFSILPTVIWRLGLARNRPMIVAPRGEFSLGALALSATKKRLYLALARLVRLYEGVVWHASTEHEANDVKRQFASAAGPEKEPKVATDLFEGSGSGDSPVHSKQTGALRVVFVSRISRKKNLIGALEMLSDLKGAVELRIFGPMEDRAYWKECLACIESLPSNVTVEYRGEAPHEEIRGILLAHDLFLFPTFGENFGHVIAEALTTARPVVISDQTPWQGLEEAEAGWDIPLDQPERFRKALQLCVDMGPEEYAKLCAGAMRFGQRRFDNARVLQQYRDLFSGNETGVNGQRCLAENA
jgi:glycosyltransferase involved in cell wall biosynthesis